MNFYNPYYMPMAAPKMGLFNTLFKGFSFSKIISGTQKTLNFVNQAIPVVKEISPMLKNTKTIFKIFNEFNKQSVSENTIVNSVSTNIDTYQNGPTFFK